MNGHLGGAVDWIVPVNPGPTPHHEGTAALAADMRGGRVDTLIVLDTNPAYATPGFAEAMQQIR